MPKSLFGELCCVVVITTAAALSIGCGGRAGEADVILAGGLIWAGPGAPFVAGEAPTAIAIAGGKILAVGTYRGSTRTTLRRTSLAFAASAAAFHRRIAQSFATADRRCQ